MRSFHHAEFPADRLRAARVESVSVCVPAREEAATIAGVVGPLIALREAGVVDQVLVLDDDSRDGTGAIAAALGAEVVRPAALLPAFGPVLGKGDAMWRALSAVSERPRVLRRRRLGGLRRALRDRPARPARSATRRCSSSRASIAGRSRAARAGRSDRRRPRHRADGPPAAGGVLSGAGRGPPAAGGRVRRAPRPARAHGVLHRLRRRDRHAARRLGRGRRARRSRRSTSTCARTATGRWRTSRRCRRRCSPP